MVDFLSEADTFQLLDYQRPYAWTTEQVGKLRNDLLTVLEDGGHAAPTKEFSPYFLESVVLIKEEDKANADVVDG